MTLIGFDALRAQRKLLTDAVAATETDDFPGSRRWMAYSKALKALDAFDRTNPQVHAEIMAEHHASVDARTIPAGGR